MTFNQLPDDFTPGDNDVVIGKGKKHFFHNGNAMLRDLAAMMLDEYTKAETKLDKSLIISDITDHVREGGHFVKRDITTDKWVIAEDLLCREKVSAVFRDAIRNRSSAFRKRSLHHPEDQRSQCFVTTPQPTLGAQDMDWEEPTSEAFEPHGCTTRALSGSQSSAKNDVFSIFAVALANVYEDGDPFEPKPFYEGPASA